MNASDRLTRLKCCLTDPTPRSTCCPNQLVSIDPANNTVCLDPSCSLVGIDPARNTVQIAEPLIVTVSGGDVTASTTLNLANSTGDAFGRLRVSNPYTLFEFNSIHGTQPPILDEQIVAPASSTWVNGDSYIRMAVTGAGGSVIRQSHDYIIYQPGKSKLVFLTGVLYEDATATSALTTRIGTYDASFGGVYIQMQNGIISVNLQDGSTSTIQIPRASWTDPLDGTGPSGAVVDFTKAQIFFFDMEWLGVGQVRCGIVQSGVYHYYYIFTNANILLAPYVQTAKLPVRYEIISTGSVNVMRMICGTVISEGGFSPLGTMFTASIDTGGVTVTNNTFIPIVSLSLRTASPYNRGTIKLKHMDIFNTNTNSTGVWKIVLNPTITGSPAWADFDTVNNSIARIRRDNGVGTVTNQGRVLYQGYYSTRANEILFNTTDELVNAPGIASDIGGTPDVFVLITNWLVGSGASQIYAGLRWLELM